MHRILKLLLGNLLAPCCLAATTELPPLVIHASPHLQEQAPPLTATGDQYRDAEQIEHLAGKGGSNSYTLLRHLPGVQADTQDAWGLVNPQGGSKGLRVRGEMAAHGTWGTVNGVPLSGPGPGPGQLFLLDHENLAGMTLTEGAVSPERFSLYNSLGQLDLQPLWPQQQAAIRLDLSAGSDAYQRAFLRLDSGRKATGTALFFSTSATRADHWRGPGQAPEQRNNLALGLSQSFDRLQLRLLALHNRMDADHYLGLTHAQSRNPALYDQIHYDATPQGNSLAEWAQWQGYNRQSFESTALLGELDYVPTAGQRFSLKPFWSREQGEYRHAAGNLVRQWLFDHDFYGLLGQWQGQWQATGLTLGYAWVTMKPPAPPTLWKDHVPAADGSLAFQRWNLLVDVTQPQVRQDLFAVLEQRLDDLTLKAGLRGVHHRLPGLDYYDTLGVANGSTTAAIEQSTGRMAERSVDPVSWSGWLPYLQVDYDATASLQLGFKLGRTLGQFAYEVFPAPAPVGMTKQQQWDALEPELADSLDLAALLRWPQGHLRATLFHKEYRNKAVNLYDPDYGASYLRNLGQARQRGLTLQAEWQPAPSWSLFANAAWLDATFTEDLQVSASQTLKVAGQQLPDVPRWMASLGLAWQGETWRITPVWRYMGQRHADVQHQQIMNAYQVVDLDMDYTWPGSQGGISLGLSVINLLDETYIGYNNANEINGGNSFFPGAPRSLLGRISLAF